VWASQNGSRVGKLRALKCGHESSFELVKSESSTELKTEALNILTLV